MNNRNRRCIWRPVILLFALAAMLLSSCAGFIPTAEPVTLTFGFPTSDLAYYQSLLPGFNEKYPNITITLTPYQDGPELPTDVVILPWSLSPDLSQQNALLPLDSFIAQEKDFQVEDFYPSAMEALKVDGKQIAIPSGVDPWMMYYNKDLFDRYGVPYPQAGWTWTDFLALAQAVRHPEDNIYGYSNLEGYVDSLFFLYQHGGALGDSSGNPTLNTLANIEAVEWYASLFQDYQVAPTTKQAQSDFGFSRSATIFGLINGKIGMFIAQYSVRGGMTQFPAEWNFKWGAVPLPHEEQAFTGAFFEGIAIMKQSQNPDASWKWVSYLSLQAHNRLIPARISRASSPEFAELVGEDVAQAGLNSMTDALLVSNENIGQYAKFIDIYFATLDKLVNSDSIVQEELDKAQTQAEKQTQ